MEPTGNRQTRTPECGGTSPLNVPLRPLPIQGKGLGPAVMSSVQRVRGHLAEKPPKRPPGVWLQWRSTSPCLKAGVSVPPAKSSLWTNIM